MLFYIPDSVTIVSNTKQHQCQQEERRLVLEEGCSTTKMLRANDSYERLLENPQSFKKIIFNDQYQLLYCYIPKVLHRSIVCRWTSIPLDGCSSLVGLLFNGARWFTAGYRSAFAAWFALKVFVKAICSGPHQVRQYRWHPTNHVHNSLNGFANAAILPVRVPLLLLLHSCYFVSCQSLASVCAHDAAWLSILLENIPFRPFAREQQPQCRCSL